MQLGPNHLKLIAMMLLAAVIIVLVMLDDATPGDGTSGPFSETDGVEQPVTQVDGG